MPKVIHIGPAPNARGGISSVLSVLKSQGFFDRQVQLVVSYDDRGNIGKILIFISALARISWNRLRGAKILHLHSAAYTSFWRKSLFFALAKLLGMKVILHWHTARLTAFIEGSGKLKLKTIRYVFYRSDQIITVSKETRREINHFFPDLPCVVAYNPANLSYAPLPDEQLRANNEILFMAPLIREKGIYTLLDAFKIVQKTLPSVGLVACGSGEDEQVKTYAERIGVANKTEFPGWVTGKQKQAYYQRAAVFCLPSFADALPMANLDAMAAGLPVVSTLHGGIPEAVTDGTTGLLVPPHDAEALAKALLRVLSDPDLRVKMGNAGVERARVVFAPQRLKDQLLSVYRHLDPDCAEAINA